MDLGEERLKVQAKAQWFSEEMVLDIVLGRYLYLSFLIDVEILLHQARIDREVCETYTPTFDHEPKKVKETTDQ